MKLRTLNLTVILVSVLFIFSTIQIVYASPLSTFYLSGGIYPQGEYTIWKEGSYYYAKDIYGFIPSWGKKTNPSELIEKASTYGGYTFLKAGIYTIPRDTINITTSNVIIEGEGMGSTILKVDQIDQSFGTVIHIESASHVSVRHLTIDRMGTQAMYDIWDNIAFSAVDCEFLDIGYIETKNTPDYAFCFGGRTDATNINDAPYRPCNSVRFHHNYMHDGFKDGVHFFGGSNNVVEGNRFENLIDDCIAFGADQNYTISHIQIRDNIVRDCTGGTASGIKLHSGWMNSSTPVSGIHSNISITGNVIDQVTQSGFCISLERWGFPVDDMVKGLTISGNVFNQSVFINSCSDAVISDNIIYDGLLEVVSWGFYETTGADNSPHDIILKANNVYGAIRIKGKTATIHPYNIVVDSNIVNSWASYWACIMVEEGSQNVTVTNNLVVGHSTKPTNGIAVHGADNKIPPHHVLVSDNMVTNILTNGILIGKDGTDKPAHNITVRDNYLKDCAPNAIIKQTNCNDVTIKGNTGFITENSGNTTISASTSVVVNHGLAGTPDSVTVTLGTTGAGDYYVNTLTSTQFTVHVANSGTYTVYWYAEYIP